MLGLPKYLMLKQMNVRTVLDLERALDYGERDGGTTEEEGPDEFDKIYAGILFAVTTDTRRIGELGGLNAFVIRNEPERSPAGGGITTAAVFPPIEPATVDAYFMWACQTIRRASNIRWMPMISTYAASAAFGRKCLMILAIVRSGWTTGQHLLRLPIVSQ